MSDEEWKAAAMADAQKVCDLTRKAENLAKALEDLIDWATEGNYGHLKPDAYLAADKARGDASQALADWRGE